MTIICDMVRARDMDNQKKRWKNLLANIRPVGCVSCINLGNGLYEIGCLCIIPEYQGKGIGTQAIRFIKTFYEDWKKLTLVTPIDKKENVKFYTEKCGFRIESTERDGSVELVRFVAERNLSGGG